MKPSDSPLAYSSHTEKIWFYIIFGCVCGLFSYIFLEYPRSNDDHWFLFELEKEACLAVGDSTTWGGIKWSFTDHYIHDNARIGNFLGILALLLPGWLPALGTCLCFAAGLWLMAKYAMIRTGEVAKLAVLAFFATFAPLWHDAMFCQMYSFNYVWSVPLLFGTLVLFLRKQPVRPLWAGLFALFTSVWHESNAVVILGGCTVALLFNRESVRKDRLWIIAASALGMTWFLVSPSWWYRAEMQHPGPFIGRTVYMWSFAIFSALWIICFLRRDTRHIAFDPRSLICLTAGIGLTALIVISDRARSAMPAMFLSAASIPWIMSQMWPVLMSGNLRESKAMSAVLLLLTFGHLTVVCDETHTVRRQFDNIIQQVKSANPDWDTIKTPKDTLAIFADVDYSWYRPGLTLMRPNREMFMNHKAQLDFLAPYLNYRMIWVIPEELKDYHQTMGTPVEGESEVRVYKGHLVSSAVCDTAILGAIVRYDNLQEYAHITHALFTGADGMEYDYITPMRSLRSTFYGEPTYFSFDRDFVPPTKE